MSRPKQMAVYDKFEITGEGYILHDDAYLSGEGEKPSVRIHFLTAGIVPTARLNYKRLKTKSFRNVVVVIIVYGTVNIAASGKYAYIPIRSANVCHRLIA